MFKFSFATGRETRVASANGARSSEFLPSIWDTRIAFARVYERREGKAGDRAYLYARAVLGVPFGAPEAARELREDLRHSTRATNRCAGSTSRPGRPRWICVGGGWPSRGNARGFCPASITGVWLDTVGGGRRQVETTCTTNLQGREIVSPTISAGRVYYVWSLTGGELGTAGSIRSYRISSRRRSEILALKSRVIMWSATDAGRTFYLLSGGFTGGCAPDPGSPGSAGPCFINEFTH